MPFPEALAVHVRRVIGGRGRRRQPFIPEDPAVAAERLRKHRERQQEEIAGLDLRFVGNNTGFFKDREWDMAGTLDPQVTGPDGQRLPEGTQVLFTKRGSAAMATVYGGSVNGVDLTSPRERSWAARLASDYYARMTDPPPPGE